MNEVRGWCYKCDEFSDGFRLDVVKFICIDCATQEMYETIISENDEDFRPLPEDYHSTQTKEGGN